MGGRKATDVPSLYTPRTSLVISHSYALLQDYGYTEQDIADVVASCKHCDEEINEAITRMVMEGSEGRAWHTVQKEPKPANKSRQRPGRDDRAKNPRSNTATSARPRDRPNRPAHNAGNRREQLEPKEGGRERERPAVHRPTPTEAAIEVEKVQQNEKTQTENKEMTTAAPTKKNQSDRTSWAKKLQGGTAKDVSAAAASPSPVLSSPAEPAAPAPKARGKNSWVSRARGDKGPATPPVAAREEPAPAAVTVEETIVVEAAVVAPAPAAHILESAVLPPVAAEVPPAVSAKPVIVRSVLNKPVPPPAESGGGIEHTSSAKPVIRTKILSRRDDISTVTIPPYVPDRASLELAASHDYPERILPEAIGRHQVSMPRTMDHQYVPQQSSPQYPPQYAYDRMRYAPHPQQEYYAPPSYYQRVPQTMGGRMEEELPAPHMDQTRYYQPPYQQQQHYGSNLPPYESGGLRQAPAVECEQAYSMPMYRPDLHYAQYGANHYAREERRENHYGAQYGMPPIFMTAAPQVDERSSGRYANYNPVGAYQPPTQYSANNLFKY